MCESCDKQHPENCTCGAVDCPHATFEQIEQTARNMQLRVLKDSEDEPYVHMEDVALAMISVIRLNDLANRPAAQEDPNALAGLQIMLASMSTMFHSMGALLAREDKWVDMATVVAPDTIPEDWGLEIPPEGEEPTSP